jgi:hypothetical protein
VYVYIPIVTDEDSVGRTVEEVLDSLLRKKEERAKSVIVPSGGMDVTIEDWLAALGIESTAV